MSFRLSGILCVLGILLLSSASAFAATFTVNLDGSFGDATIGDGTCATGVPDPPGCTLHAAIQEANNAPGGPHTIVFSIAVVTPTSSLPQIIAPVTIDGIFGAPRVEIVGSPGVGSFSVSDTAGGATPGSGTTIKNLVIRNMSGNGISLVGGGHSVFNCYIGTDKFGMAAQANTGDGIDITSTGPAFTFPPDLTGIGVNLIGNPVDPTSGNLVSGNGTVGIYIHGQRAVLTTVAFNKIGTNNTGLAAIPNGSSGVVINGNAFAHTIGPGNIISGNNNPNSYGIEIDGTVMIPNVITTNIIGPASGLLIDLGQTLDGINIDCALADISIPEAATVGPANIIGYNDANGVQIAGAKVRVFGNFIGVAEDPITAGSFIDLGNDLNGIRVTTAGHQIGGASIPETNVIAANNQSGILLTPSSATDVVVQGNIIGRDPFNLTNFPNTLDGITLTNAGNNKIGGTNPGEANVIAGNGRNGIKVTSSGSGFSNLMTRNSIFGNQTQVNGMGIDLEYAQQAPDPTDNATPAQDPNTAYAQYGQNAPVIATGVNAPQYNPATGATIVNWTLATSNSTPVTLEFFASDAPGYLNFGEGQTYLGTVTTTTDGTGNATGPSTVTPSSPYDTRGKYITMTVTPTNLIDPPGPNMIGQANNTSEFSNAVLVPNPGTLQFSSPMYSVGEAGVTATITVTRTGGTDGAVSVDYATSDGTATDPPDYGTAASTLNWADGDGASKTFMVTINNDNTFEPDETVNLTLTNPGGFAELGIPSAAVLTITNDDPQPTISINDVTLAEGNAGTTSFSFDVTLSNPSSQTITVNFATADNSATLVDNDYAANSGTVTFNPGVVSQPVVVMVNGDVTTEPDETFFVNLTVPSNATINDAQGVGTIQNDDAATPTFTIDNVTQAEGNAGTTAFTFTVTLTPPAGVQVTVQAATADGTATVADSDYAANMQTLTFNAGVPTQQFTVNVNGDTKFEPDEDFTVNLSANSPGTLISGGTGVGTITNDDAQPTISIDDVSLLEGNAGTTSFNFNVTLSNPSFQTITVNFATADNSATLADNDYAINTGTVTFNPGVVSQPVTVLVNGDTTDEPIETFFVNLTVPSNATINDGQGVGTIQNDDAVIPTFTIDNVTQAEGNAGTTAFTFTVTLTPVAGVQVTVQAATADGTATVADNDYAANTQTLTFNAGVPTQQFTVNVNGDTTFEPTEAFTVNLSANSPGTLISGGTGTGTITNDDVQPSISINDVSLAEGNAATTPFNFNVTLSNASSQTITVNFATADDTATLADNDYATNSGMLTFNPGVLSQPVSVLVTGDTTNELNETFFVNLSVPSNATIGDGQGLGTIQNDDAATADLSVTKSDTPDPVLAGANITYTIGLTNSGPSDAANVSLTDNTPANTTFVSLTAPAGYTSTTPPVGGTGTVTITRPTLTTGTTDNFTLVVQVGVATPNGTIISNTASVTSTTTDPVAGNNSANATTTVSTLSADLSVTKTDTPDPVVAGSNITYTIALTNSGPNDAASVSLTDNIPANTTFVSLTAPAGYTSTTPPVGGTGTVTITRPLLTSGTTDNFTLVVNVNAATPNGTIITNTATVTSATADPNAANNSQTATTTVGSAGADVAITKTDSPDPILAGANITYAVTITNNGPADATSVVLTDATPANTTFVSLTAPAGYVCTTPPVGGTGNVTCSTGTLLNAASSNFTLVVNVNGGTAAGTIITNTATVATASADANPANNTATATTTVSAAALSADLMLTKSDSPDPVGIGGALTYSLTVQNNGPDQATGVTITDNLPGSVTFVSASAGCANVALVVTCTVGTLASGGTATVTIQVTPTVPGPIVNNATVTAAESDPVPANNAASAATTVLASSTIPTLSPLMLLLLAIALVGVTFTLRGMR